jgi:hypothetical protein
LKVPAKAVRDPQGVVSRGKQAFQHLATSGEWQIHQKLSVSIQ